MNTVVLLVGLVFVAVFIVTALLLVASQAGASKRLKETLARLDSVTIAAQRSAEADAALIKREELLSNVPWLDRTLRSIAFFSRTRLLLQQAEVNWTVGGLCAASLACWVAASAVLYLRTGGLAPSLLIGAAAASIPWIYVLRARARRFATFELRLPEALDLVVSALRAGHGLNSAIGTVAKEVTGPVGREFRQCFDEMNFGLELREAMTNLAARVPIQDVKIIVTAILVQKESGGNLAEVLDNVAKIIRERFRLKREILTRTAQGRLTGWILAGLPPVLGGLLYFANPGHMSLLWTHPTGVKLLYAGTAMTLIGGLIIRKIVSIRV